MPLLNTDEPEALTLERTHDGSDFLLACDHASNRIPRSLGSLGLSAAQLASHAAWDIGAAGVARRLAELLNATVALQNYSRLVIDCNRPPGSASSIAVRSEYLQIAANEGLTPGAVAERVNAIFRPYHDGLSAVLDRRGRAGRQTLLVAMHSFTPVYHGQPRPWHVGLMFRRDRRLGQALLELLRREPELQVGDQEPYAITDDTDYTIPVHAEARQLAHVGIEIRQDLIADQGGQQAWAARLAPLLTRAASACERPGVV